MADAALFRVHRSQLLPALDAACAGADRSATIPILSHVLLRPEGDQLRLRGTDLNIEIEAVCELLDTSHSSGIALAASDLLGLVKSLPEAAEIEFLPGRFGGQIAIRTKASKFTLLSLPEADFPSISSQLDGDQFGLDVSPFISAIGKVLFAVDKADTGRPYTLGIYLAPEENGDRLLVAATNTRTLGIIRLRTQSPARFDPVIIPGKLAQTMRKLFSDEKSVATMMVSDHLMRVSCGNVSIFSRLIDGEFPVKIFETLPKEPDYQIIASVDALKSSVRRILLVAGDYMKEGVRVSLQSGGLRLELVNSQGESAVEHVPVDFEGTSDFSIGLNAKLIDGVLDSVATQDVRLGLTSGGNTVFRPTADIDDMFAIAPMNARGVDQ
ncbi:DNA polymerase III beta subunit [Neorhizobium sp. R1-B]|uniref:DNA polymerase III subunit beta n=1 Tax=Neorhizobium sp. R1-B TaxID=2485162 RepID=UPI0010EFE88A|nr:DNA polymerase III subunit beta [Neorhizobium sp. R1-B]TDX72625.1 DNA polymerase III beta subunit [Neorhizobium sp. R1-B]